LPHRALGNFDIAPALGYHRAHECRNVIQNFVSHDARDVAAKRANRMGRPGIGAGRHGCDVSAFQNKKARRRSTAAAGGDVDNHGNPRGDDLLHDLLHGIAGAAWRIQFNQHGGILIGRGTIDGPLDALGSRRLNGVVHHNLKDVGAGKD